MTNIREALLAEYIRLSARDARLTALVHQANTETAKIRKRTKALRAAFEEYGIEKRADAESWIATGFAYGYPVDFIIDILRDNHGFKGGEAEILAWAAKIGAERPKGWSEELADEQWSAAGIEDDDWLDRFFGIEDDDWLDRFFGIPEPTLDEPPPELLRLPAPEVVEPPVVPPSVELTAEPVVLVPEPPKPPDKPLVAPTDGRLTGPRIPMDQRQKTPDRVTLLKAIWFTERSREQILNELNMLVGVPITPKSLVVYVVSWGVSHTGSEDFRVVEARRRGRELAKRLEDEMTPKPGSEFGKYVESPSKGVVMTTIPSAPIKNPAVAALAAKFQPDKPPPATTTWDSAKASPTVNLSQSGRAVGEALARTNGTVLADAATIQNWGAARGIITGKLDLDRVNKKRRDLQLPPFELEEVQRTRRMP